jgi:DNA-binding response OmpR family regulator
VKRFIKYPLNFKKGGRIMNQIQETIEPESHGFPHVLIMEDELSVAKGLQMALTEEGYFVDLAHTGQSALDTFNKKSVDLLVADLRLPDIDGMEVIRKIKHDQPDTGVIVITGYSTVPSAVEAMKLGACDYLPKPFTEDEFKSAVKGALEEKEGEFAKDILETVAHDAKKLVQKREVVKVLNRTVEDEKFWGMLMNGQTEALKAYHLSSEARAAIVSGDLNWMIENVGRLSERQLMFIYTRLERESWYND